MNDSQISDLQNCESVMLSPFPETQAHVALPPMRPRASNNQLLSRQDLNTQIFQTADIPSLHSSLQLHQQNSIRLYENFCKIVSVIQKSAEFQNFSDEQAFQKYILSARDKLSESFAEAPYPLYQIYVGQLRKGTPDGFGCHQLNEGEFVGEFQMGQQIGFGCKTWTNHYLEEGYFKNFQLNGKGTVRFASGHVWEGQFIDGYLFGKGKKTFANGDVYEGELMHSLMHGRGKLVNARGEKFEGEFKNNFLNGQAFLNDMEVVDDEVFEKEDLMCIQPDAGQDQLNESAKDEFLKQQLNLNLTDESEKMSLNLKFTSRRGFNDSIATSRLKNTGFGTVRLQSSQNLSNLSGLRLMSGCDSLMLSNSMEMTDTSVMKTYSRIQPKQIEDYRQILQVIQEAADQMFQLKYQVAEYVKNHTDALTTNWGTATQSWGDYYIGEIYGKIPSGYGKMTTKYYTYTGQFTKFEYRGYGIQAFKSGKMLKGYFQKCMLHGVGKAILENGDIHEGDFKQGHLNGSGRKVFARGGMQEGEFEQGELCGEGRKITAEGDTEEGTFDGGHLDGRGVKQMADGTREEGLFEDGYLQLNGKRTLPDGEVWEGIFQCGYLCGAGKRTFPSGAVWEGEFKDNLLDGMGKKIKKNGEIQYGFWRAGKWIGEDKWCE